MYSDYTQLLKKRTPLREIRLIERYAEKRVCKYLKKQRLNKEDWDYIASVYKQNPYRIWRAKQVITNPANIDKIDNALQIEMSRQRLTPKLALRAIKKSLKISEEDRKPETMLKAADMILDLAGVKPSRVTIRQTQTTNTGLSDAYDKAKGEQKQITTTKSVSIEQPNSVCQDDNNKEDVT